MTIFSIQFGIFHTTWNQTFAVLYIHVLLSIHLNLYGKRRTSFFFLFSSLCCCWILISYFYILFGNSTMIFQVIRSDPWHDKYNPYGPENESLSSAASWKVIFLSLSHASSNLLMTDFQKKKYLLINIEKS